MKFCPDCGTGHDCTASDGLDKTRVEITRLETTRDIEVARLNARAATTIAETEAEHAADHAEGVAEGMGEAIDALTGSDETDPGAPIVVDATPDPEPVVEEEPDNAPPVVEVPEPKSSNRGGYWSAYR